MKFYVLKLINSVVKSIKNKHLGFDLNFFIKRGIGEKGSVLKYKKINTASHMNQCTFAV